mgnify:CR=1 FL=1
MIHYYRIAFHFPVLEYENALIEFDGDISEAILQRVVANPIHVYKLVREMEMFSSGIVSKLTESPNSNGRYFNEKKFLEIFSIV